MEIGFVKNAIIEQVKKAKDQDDLMKVLEDALCFVNVNEIGEYTRFGEDE